MKRKPSYKKWCFWTIIVGSIVGVPIVINELYKCDKGYITVWEGSDVLAYYGSLLGAAATIIALVVTIIFTQKNQKEERKLSVKPYLETKKYHYTDLMNISLENTICLEITSKGIKDPDRLLEKINDAKIIYHRDMHGAFSQIAKISLDTEISGILKKYYFCGYDIQNCGAGNAINVNLKINNKSCIPDFCVTTSEPKKFILIFDKSLLEEPDFNECFVRIDLEYMDIVSLAKYSQYEELIFSCDENDLSTMQLTGQHWMPPEEIDKVRER